MPRVTLISAALWSALGALGAVFALAVIWFAAQAFVSGLAGALSSLLDSAWLGQLLAGLLLACLSGGGAYLTLRRVLKNYDRSIKQRFAELRRKQRRAYGHDVQQQSEELQ